MKNSFRSLRAFAAALLAAAFILFSGCTTYIPPGAKADLNALAPASVQEGFNAQPALRFPVGITAVRLQSPTYSNFHLGRADNSSPLDRFSVITTREVEDPELLDRLATLPKVSGLIGLNRLLLPSHLSSEKDLRSAAARLQADLLFLYTFETTFHRHDQAMALTAVSLGLAPTKKIRVTTTLSALLIDTRTGYVYSAYETREQQVLRSTAFQSAENADQARRDNERAAFAKLVAEVEASWPRLLTRYETKP